MSEIEVKPMDLMMLLIFLESYKSAEQPLLMLFSSHCNDVSEMFDHIMKHNKAVRD